MPAQSRDVRRLTPLGSFFAECQSQSGVRAQNRIWAAGGRQAPRRDHHRSHAAIYRVPGLIDNVRVLDGPPFIHSRDPSALRCTHVRCRARPVRVALPAYRSRTSHPPEHRAWTACRSRFVLSGIGSVRRAWRPCPGHARRSSALWHYVHTYHCEHSLCLFIPGDSRANLTCPSAAGAHKPHRELPPRCDPALSVSGRSIDCGSFGELHPTGLRGRIGARLFTCSGLPVLLLGSGELGCACSAVHSASAAL